MLVPAGEELVAHRRLLCRHPYEAHKRCYITPAAVKPLLTTVFVNGKPCVSPLPRSASGTCGVLEAARAHACAELQSLDGDTLRALEPRQYKVCLSPSLFASFHELWDKEANGHLPPSRQPTPAPLDPPVPPASAPTPRGSKRPLDDSDGASVGPVKRRHEGTAVATALGIAALTSCVAYALLAHTT